MANINLKDLIGDQEGVLEEDAQNFILEAFNKKLEEVSAERVELALEAMDQKHTASLQQIVEKYEDKISSVSKTVEEQLDEEHANAAAETFNKLEEDRVGKMVQVKEHYETLLSESVSEHVESLVEGVDKYLDAFLDEHIPTDIIQEAARKDYSQDLLSKISKLVTLDEKVDDDIREGIIEAKQTIEEQTKQIEALKRESLLAEKTANLPTLEKNFMLESLGNKSVEYIERNFDYVKTLFLKNEEETIRENSNASINVDRPIVIEESSKDSEEGEVLVNSAMAAWTKTVKSKGFYD